MQDVKKQFMDELKPELIRSFCSRSNRNMTPEGFRCENLKNLHETDMEDFLRGWKEKLFRDLGEGLYETHQGGSKEQFFWSGLKTNSPRTFSLWLEPVIALGVLARMHLDFKWPRELIGSQTRPAYAFDVFGCESLEKNQTMRIVCEVKKSTKEIDALVADMHEFGLKPALTKESLQRATAKNALMKVEALRDKRPGIFWAVGPGRYEKVFSVEYSGDVVKFLPPSKEVRMYGSWLAGV